MGRFFKKVSISIWVLSFASATSQAELRFATDRRADERLAQNLIQIINHPQLATKGFSDDQNLLAANDGTPYESNTAYHDYKFHYCRDWLNATTCREWLYPYVSLHGFEGGGDKSPLETMVASSWEQLKTEPVGQGGQFGIWQITPRGERSVFTQIGIKKGTIDAEAVGDWRLIPQVEQQAKQIGLETAERELVLAKEKGDADELANGVKLRAIAAARTRTLRNRLVANLGEARAAQRGIEFELGEDRSNCQEYEAQYKQLERQLMVEGTINIDRRDIETRLNERLGIRAQLCQQVRQFGIYDVNPIVENGQLKLGGADQEAFDRAMNRINVAVIDYAGLDPNSQAKPGTAAFGAEDVSSELVNYNDGGRGYTTYRATNAQQLQSYNQSLEQAKVNMDAVIAREPQFRNNVDDPTKFKINPLESDLVSINGLPESVKFDLRNTELAGSPLYEGTGPFSSNPEQTLEQSPAQLNVVPIQ